MKVLNTSPEFQNARIASSPRSVGDLVQDIAGEKMASCFPPDTICGFSDAFARRAMADVAFSDRFNNYYIVDLKTHNRSTQFNMPNLTSEERLARLYEDDTNFFVILLAEYQNKDDVAVFEHVQLFPIENLDWECLTIGALGWGQIQIANANRVKVDPNLTRKEWMLSLCDALDIFYPREIEKIARRHARFKELRQFWENK